MKTGRVRGVVGLVACALVTCLALAATTVRAAEDAASLPRLMSPDDLARAIERSDIQLCIVDMRESVADYWKGHIPGSVYLSVDTLTCPDGGVPAMLAPGRALVAVLGRMGISRRTHVVVYGSAGDYRHAYLLWALDHLGHDALSVLDGGFDAWERAGLPLTQDYPSVELTRYEPLFRSTTLCRVDLDQVKALLDDEASVLVDARPGMMYAGLAGAWKRLGHIPGAVNRYWADDLTADGLFRDPEVLRDEYSSLGVTPDKYVIVSCGVGMMSAHTYFTLKYVLGYPNVANYDGGFNEWSNVDELPVEAGGGQ